MIARTFVLDEDRILLIHRFKRGQEYFVLPGRNVKEGESPRDAALRQLKEETNLVASVEKKLWQITGLYNKNQPFFPVKYFSGLVRLSCPGAKRNCEQNRYISERHNFSDVKKIYLVSGEVKRKIINEFL